MNPIKKTIIISALAIAFSATAQAESGLAPHENKYYQDSSITERVKAAVTEESTLRVPELDIVTTNGIVQLSGFVGSEADSDQAAEIARSVKGVTAVQNRLTVLSGTDSPMNTPSMNSDPIVDEPMNFQPLDELIR